MSGPGREGGEGGGGFQDLDRQTTIRDGYESLFAVSGSLGRGVCVCVGKTSFRVSVDRSIFQAQFSIVDHLYGRTDFVERTIHDR